MSWLPGVGPVKDIATVGVTRGLSAGWYDDKAAVGEITKGNFWDIIDNPLYEAAAGAAGFNWTEWVADARTKVPLPGSPGEQVRARIPGRGGRYQLVRRHRGRGGLSREYVRRQDRYELLSRSEAEDKGYDFSSIKSTRWRNKDTGEIVNDLPAFDPGRVGIATAGNAVGIGGLLSGFGGFDEDWKDDWEELRDWGVWDEGVAADLDGMQVWLEDIVNINNHLPDIIREGPKGEHYGIEGDIWEHYGLDKEPEPPKEMDWDSAEKHMVLSKAVRSTEGYSTPEGITPINLHGD